MSELKPCPFCGMKDEARYDKAHNGAYIFRCQWCGAEVRSQDDWNSRPIEDSLRAENERLRELLARVEWCDSVRNEQHEIVPGCWFCEQHESGGKHADDCELHNALEGTPEVKVSPWISVNDLLPEDGQEIVIICFFNFTKYRARMVAVYKDGVFHTQKYLLEPYMVSHWLPLPEIPEVKE